MKRYYICQRHLARRSGLARAKALTNIILLDVGVDERDLGLVRGVLQRRLDDLVHRSDTGASGDHQQVGREVSAGEGQQWVGAKGL